MINNSNTKETMTAVINNTVVVKFNGKHEIPGIISEFIRSNEQQTICINKQGDPLAMKKGVVRYAKKSHE